MREYEAHPALKGMEGAGEVLFLATILAKFLGFWEHWNIYVLYAAVALILLSAFRKTGARRITSSVLSRLGGIAILLWILLAVFSIQLLAFTSTQLFWLAVLSFAAKVMVDVA